MIDGIFFKAFRIRKSSGIFSGSGFRTGIMSNGHGGFLPIRDLAVHIIPYFFSFW